MCDYYDDSHESSQEEYGNNDYLNEQLGVTSSGEGHLTNDGSDIKYHSTIGDNNEKSATWHSEQAQKAAADGNFDMAKEHRMAIEPSGNSSVVNHSQIPFLGQNENDEWNKKQEEHALNEKAWHRKEADKAAEKGDYASMKDHRAAADAWHNTAVKYRK